MQKKLKAVVDDLGDGTYSVVVTDWDTGKETTIIQVAKNEKDAAFKAMEVVNDQ